MKTTPASALSRSFWPVIALALVLLLGVWWFRSEPEPRFADTDARIAWYKARVGGRGTYPLHARLGLACLQKARETGQPQWFAEAERHLRTSVGYQANYEGLLGLGMVHAARHEFAEAQRYATEATAAMPESLEAQGLLFEIALALGDTERAGAVVASMTARAPGTFEATTREAAFQEYRGQMQAALDATTAACNDANGRSLPAGLRAWCEVRRGSLQLAARCDPAGAEQAYQKALSILPDYYFAREHLAELRAAQGVLSEATTLTESLLRDVPGPRYRLALADVYELEGKHDPVQALRQQANDEFWREALRGSHEHVAAHAVLLVEITSGVSEALQMIEDEWKSRKDTITAAALARIYLAGGMQQEAEQAMDEAMRSGRRNPDLLLSSAEIHLQGDRRDEARALLGQATVCPAALTPGEQLLARKLHAALPQ